MKKKKIKFPTWRNKLEKLKKWLRGGGGEPEDKVRRKKKEKNKGQSLKTTDCKTREKDIEKEEDKKAELNK